MTAFQWRFSQYFLVTINLSLRWSKRNYLIFLFAEIKNCLFHHSIITFRNFINPVLTWLSFHLNWNRHFKMDETLYSVLKSITDYSYLNGQPDGWETINYRPPSGIRESSKGDMSTDTDFLSVTSTVASSVARLHLLFLELSHVVSTARASTCFWIGMDSPAFKSSQIFFAKIEFDLIEVPWKFCDK